MREVSLEAPSIPLVYPFLGLHNSFLDLLPSIPYAQHGISNVGCRETELLFEGGGGPNRVTGALVWPGVILHISLPFCPNLLSHLVFQTRLLNSAWCATLSCYSIGAKAKESSGNIIKACTWLTNAEYTEG